MAVTDTSYDAFDDIPHGLEGYRRYACRCDVCRAANAEYSRERRARDKLRQARKNGTTVRKIRATPTVQNTITGSNRPSAPARASGPVSRETPSAPPTLGLFEEAVVTECSTLESAKTRPVSVVAARGLARILDNPKMAAIHVATTRQLMAIMAELRGDTGKIAKDKRKSGGRLASVQSLAKVKRSQ